MKRLLLIIFLVFILTSCTANDISESLFIASIGIEKEEDKLYGYFYLPLSNDIGKSENMENKGKGDYAKVQGKDVAQLFQNIKATTSLDVNFRHVSSIVLNIDLLNAEFIKELSDFIKYSQAIDFNCYIFATKEKMEDIYDFQNPNNESVLNSILVSTVDLQGFFLVSGPVHFLEFISRFYSDRNIILPMLDMEELWQVGGEKVKNTYSQSAIYYYQNQTKEIVKNVSSPYMKDTDALLDKIDNIPICFEYYKFRVQYKDQLILNVETNYFYYQSNAFLEKKIIENHIKERIKIYLEEFRQLDPLDIAYFNRIYHRNVNYDDIVYNIKFNLN